MLPAKKTCFYFSMWMDRRNIRFIWRVLQALSRSSWWIKTPLAPPRWCCRSPRQTTCFKASPSQVQLPLLLMPAPNQQPTAQHPPHQPVRVPPPPPPSLQAQPLPLLQPQVRCQPNRFEIWCQKKLEVCGGWEMLWFLTFFLFDLRNQCRHFKQLHFRYNGQSDFFSGHPAAAVICLIGQQLFTSRFLNSIWTN